MTDTIFALSSGALPAAIAIVRISGPHAATAAIALTGELPPPRQAVVRTMRHPASGDVLDRGLVLRFPAGGSVTGEELVELHLHGGIATVRAIIAVLHSIDELRPAEAGEFTRRALAAGRIDLTEAEGLADLLAAETEMQRRAAIRMADGELRRRTDDWQGRLLNLAAHVEADIEFAEDHDLSVPLGIDVEVNTIASEIGAYLSGPTVERLRDGIRVVLAGPPNVGKSSLFNALVGRDMAIVTPIAGTTRDRIEATVERDGIAYVLTDTAGLTDTADPVEAIGVMRAHDAANAADIVLWLGDGPSPYDGSLDLHPRSDDPDRNHVAGGRIATSAFAPGGLDTLLHGLAVRASAMLPNPNVAAINQRQRRVLAECRDALVAMDTDDPVFAAEGLRIARAALNELAGRDTEAVLDAVFSRFCVGK